MAYFILTIYHFSARLLKISHLIRNILSPHNKREIKLKIIKCIFKRHVHFHASLDPFCFHKRRRGCRTPAGRSPPDNEEPGSRAATRHYSLFVCRLKVNSHSGVILILMLLSGGRGNSEVSKEVNQPSQTGNATESWES